jgi:hypothetical protein
MKEWTSEEKYRSFKEADRAELKALHDEIA